MRTPVARLVGLTLTAALLAGACGGGSDDTAHVPSEIETALADYFADPENDTPVGDRAEADCAAKEIVALFGDDALMDLGVSATQVPHLPDMNMSDAQVGWVLTGLQNCLDLTMALRDVLAEEIGVENADCMIDALGETVINEILRAELANDTAQVENTNDAVEIAASICGLS